MATEEVMTPEQFFREAVEIHDIHRPDWESTHTRLDDLMEKVLRQLGYGEGMDVIVDTIRWCA